ncbi:PT domain-containing protein [Streptomyces sp. NPDC020996]|uniref:PT domain-containing protein n=1 Tax=Streptomyces sp. NPDC020996 TaxID=3154791 RepID=UPI0033CCDAED
MSTPLPPAARLDPWPSGRPSDDPSDHPSDDLSDGPSDEPSDDPSMTRPTAHP